jgi:hypothetical protein
MMPFFPVVNEHLHTSRTQVRPIRTVWHGSTTLVDPALMGRTWKREV